MTRSFSRRAWIVMLGSLLGAGGAATAAYHWRRLRRPSASDLGGMLQSRLSHLPLDPSAVDAFTREYVARYGAFGAAVHHKETFGGMFRIDALRALLPEERERHLLSFERRLVSLFLRSTDYFRTSPGTVVRYQAFADPYEVGCSNPLAKL